MKFIKTVIITLLVMAILFTGVFMAGRYGWKVFGFRACEEAAITSVDVSGSAVTIKGFYPGSFPEGFCGCYTEELVGKLYVGFRFSAVFGIFETGDFHVAIPVAGLRRQAATGVENIYPCFTAFIAGNCRLRRRWQQHPQVLWHCLEATAAAAFASQSARFPQEIPLPFRVVSKCALTGEKRRRPPISRRPPI